MKRWQVVALGVGCFVFGAIVQTGLAQARRPAFSPDLYHGKDPKAAAQALLDGAVQLAGTGSWERIAVGRVYYLSGDKTKGQQFFDDVTSGKKVAASDWFRIGRVYSEAHEWDKAVVAFDKALALDPDDDSGTIEYGALANLNHDRGKAESMFAKALGQNPKEFWHWVNSAGSYLGVAPQ